jgi:hypothetical protein
MVGDAAAAEAERSSPDQETSADETTAPWLARVVALPFVPLVAAWDAFRGLMRTWGELGVRLLTMLDPLFERLTRRMVRVGARIRPLIERLSRRIERLYDRLTPTVEWLSTVTGAVLRRWERVKARVGQVVAPGWDAARRTLRTVLSPARVAGQAVARFVRRVRAAATSTLRSIAKAIRPR